MSGAVDSSRKQGEEELLAVDPRTVRETDEADINDVLAGALAAVPDRILRSRGRRTR